MRRMIRNLIRRLAVAAGWVVIEPTRYAAISTAVIEVHDYTRHSGHLTRAYHAGKTIRRLLQGALDNL